MERSTRPDRVAVLSPMIRHPEMTPAETTDVPGPDLFMTVLRVADWPRALAWYVDTLGLLAVLTDPEHEFALLAAGTGRLALQGGRGANEADAAGAVRLVFQVPDVDIERSRLIGKGLEIDPPTENPREGYREIRLHDPGGTPITLFSWSSPPADSRNG
jgi:catechol 2,3-dioxygenase-like lactoylglutathione lyase family enzyme